MILRRHSSKGPGSPAHGKILQPFVALRPSTSTFCNHDMASLKKLTVALIASMALPAIATELPAGVITVPLIRDFNQTAYYAELQVGTPPQKEYLKIDTGSPRYSFLSSRNAVCARESQPCTTFGTFDNMTSSYVLALHMTFTHPLRP